MDVKLLADIRETEEKAKQIIANAQSKKAQMLEKARLDAMKEYDKFLKESEQHKEEQLAARRQDLKRKKKALASAHETEIEQLRLAGEAYLDSAVALVLEKFKDAV